MKSTCCVCQNRYESDDLEKFVCPDCEKSLLSHCGNAVKMDWQVDIDQDFMYYWEIECACGEKIESRRFGIDEFDKTASELVEIWKSKAKG